MAEMKSHHQMFLQYFMLHGLVDSKGVRNLFKTCCERYSQPLSNDETGRMQQLANFVMKINRNIRPFNLTIRKGFDEDDSTCYYCLVNTCDSPITRLSSDYTVNELELFKLFLGSIMMTDDATIGSVDALNLTANLEKSMTRDDAQRFYEQMVKDKWLKKSSRGELSLSTRSILELDPLIRTMYPDVARHCNICSRLCLRGQTCTHCDIKLHLYCANRYFKNRDGYMCPNCSQEWHHFIPSRESSRRESNFNTTLDDTSV